MGPVRVLTCSLTDPSRPSLSSGCGKYKLALRCTFQFKAPSEWHNLPNSDWKITPLFKTSMLPLLQTHCNISQMLFHVVITYPFIIHLNFILFLYYVYVNTMLNYLLNIYLVGNGGWVGGKWGWVGNCLWFLVLLCVCVVFYVFKMIWNHLYFP